MAEDHLGQRHDRSVLILYGSETGNSQDAAEQLGHIAQRLRFLANVVEMDSIDLNEVLKYTLVIFIISTTGQGDIPLNARKFWKSLLRKRLPPDCLSHVSFTTFGMGDSSYVKFNYASRKLHKRLAQLGACEIYPRGEADEQHEEGTDGAFLPWSLDLKSHLFESYPLPESLVPISDEEFLEPRWTLTLLEGKELYSTSQSSAASDMAPHDLIKNQQANVPCVKDPLQHNESDPATDTALPPTTMLRMHSALIATVTENSRQTSQAHWQDVRHISLVVDKKLDYQPGDIINIYPKNFPEDVNSLLKLQNWERFADIPLTFIPNATSYHKTFYQDSQFIPGLCKIPTTNPCTLRSLLLNNLDIAAIPRRYFFDVISKFCSDETHRARLQEFSNPVFTDEFFDFATRPRRSCLEVLQDFPTVQVPFKYVLALFQPLRRRQFSIASGGVLKKESGFPSEDAVRIDILVAIVKYRTVLKKIRQGVCSRYLSTLKPGTDIAITLERGSFPPLRYLGKPILLIATGTGVAPMRSILHERAYQRIECREKVGSATLIFGGRNKNADYFYRKEWEQRYLDVQIFCAWSRDQREKIYVQDIIQEQSLLIHRLLVQEGGSVFVCGSSGKMPTSVRAALVDAFAAGGSVTKEIAEGWLAAMEKQSRYVQETW